MRILLLSLLVWLSPPVKQEIETSIRREALPAAVLDWISPLTSTASRMRYFRQTDGTDTSYEVKFRLGEHEWSVEFDFDGRILDAERITDIRALPAGAIAHLDTRFARWRATRIQAQHQPSVRSTDRAAWFARPEGVTGYEVVVEAMNGPELGRFELRFDAEGTFLLERRILETPVNG